MSPKTTDASLWRWSVITTPVLASAALFAAGALLDQLRVEPWFVVPVAACAVVGTIVASHKADLGRFASTYAALAVAGSGTWLVWVSASTAWSTTAITVLLCGLVVLGPMWFLARHAQHRKRLRDREEERRKLIAAEAQRWPDILAALGMPGVTLLERANHGGVGSYSLHLRLPVNGRVRFGVLKTRTEELEIAAGLRYGALNVERGDTAADVWLHVNEIDVLAQTIPLPKDSAPLTINRPLPLGLYEDGTVLEVLMQGRASKTVGLRGKGKSNLINAKISALTRCVDVVVWIMDNKGGRTARPWLLPWLDGRTHRPVLDWVATTREENTRMLKAAVAVIEYRSNSGIGGDKIIPTARMPELMLICEEVALIFGQHEIANYGNAKLGLTIAQLGRAEAVSIDLVAQRGTVTMLGSGDLKSQLENTFGLGVADANDARYTFGDSKIASDLAKLEHPGSLLVQAGRDTRIVPGKAWWVEHAEIGGPGGIAERNTYVGPDLDAGSAAAADTAGGYSSRWSNERAGHLLPSGLPQSGSVVTPPTPAASTVKTTAVKLGLPESKIVQFPRPSNEQPAEQDKTRPAEEKRVPPILQVVHDAFTAVESDRIHTTRLLGNPKLTGMTAKRLGMLLAACGVQPQGQPFVENGERGRGYHYSDVATALQRIIAGRIRPPDYAYDWTESGVDENAES